jgi:ribonuclease BN (tRNA processing enzyme)
MKLTFYGARGSYPISRPDNVRYGGNSTCLYLQTSGGTELIMDGGSGVVNLGHEMMDREFGRGEGQATVLVGHTHWDHILGYPFFPPFYREGNRFTFVSAGQTGQSIQEILSGQHHDLHFPVPFDHLAASIEYHDFSIGERMRFGDAEVRTFQLNHPGLTVAYRIEADAAAVLIITDTARIHASRLGDGMGGMDPDPAFARRYTEALTVFAAGVDLLVHDAHFFEHEIRSKEHWGHSTGEDGLILARAAGIPSLALFHHAPEHSDAEVDTLLQNTRDLARLDDIRIFAAAEGETEIVGSTSESSEADIGTGIARAGTGGSGTGGSGTGGSGTGGSGTGESGNGSPQTKRASGGAARDHGAGA